VYIIFFLYLCALICAFGNYKDNMKQNFYLFACMVMCMVGCATPKQLTMFTGMPESVAEPQVQDYTIDPEDVLNISFSTVLGDGAQPYNSAGSRFIVRKDSTIKIPVIGSIHVVGMTTDELTNYLEARLVGQIKQPIVHVTMPEAVISVLGEVSNPSAIISSRPIRLTEVLSRVGGPTRYARLDNVLVQRCEGGVLKSYRINLKEDDLSLSPCYFLRKGDVLYIAPGTAKKLY